MTRIDERAGFDDLTRLRLLEADADQADRRLKEQKQHFQIELRELQAAMQEGFARCEEDSDGLRKLLTGLLVAIVTSCITIVVTVLITVGGT